VRFTHRVIDGQEVSLMMTIVTRVTLKEASEPEWDAAMRARLAAARRQPGWIGAQLLIPLDDLRKRVLIGTWKTRADWEAWHKDPAFAETRQRLAGLEAAPSEEWWHEVILDARGAVDMSAITTRLDEARTRIAEALIATANRLRSGRKRA
jgi:heme-degrading monooxygenase HmoA